MARGVTREARPTGQSKGRSRTVIDADPGFAINGWCEAIGFAPPLKGVLMDSLKLAGLPE